MQTETLSPIAFGVKLNLSAPGGVVARGLVILHEEDVRSKATSSRQPFPDRKVANEREMFAGRRGQLPGSCSVDHWCAAASTDLTAGSRTESFAAI